jgi:hypothetical protein
VVLLEARGWNVDPHPDHGATSPAGDYYWHLDQALTVAPPKARKAPTVLTQAIVDEVVRVSTKSHGVVVTWSERP